MGSCRAWSVYLTTLLLGRLRAVNQYCAHSFATSALLESAEGREWPKKVFHDQPPRKNVADPAEVEPATY